MAYIRCEFRGGEILVPEQGRLFLEFGGLEEGSCLRGALLLTAALLLVRSYWLPAAVLFAAATLWSVLAMAIKNWRQVRGRCRARNLLRRGEDAEEVRQYIRVGGRLWRWRLGLLCRKKCWKAVGEELEALPDGEEKKFLLAVALLGQGQARQALALCPPRPEEEWLTLKAEILFQLEEWNKLLRMLGPAGGKDKLERTWLKGVSYYRMKQYKPAARLLSLVVRQGGPEYGDAALLLERALARR